MDVPNISNSKNLIPPHFPTQQMDLPLCPYHFRMLPMLTGHVLHRAGEVASAFKFLQGLGDPNSGRSSLATDVYQTVDGLSNPPVGRWFIPWLGCLTAQFRRSGETSWHENANSIFSRRLHVTWETVCTKHNEIRKLVHHFVTPQYHISSLPNFLNFPNHDKPWKAMIIADTLFSKQPQWCSGW